MPDNRINYTTIQLHIIVKVVTLKRKYRSSERVWHSPTKPVIRELAFWCLNQLQRVCYDPSDVEVT